MASDILIGSIVVGAAASKNNTDTTGTPFLIPPGVKSVYLRTSAADVTYNKGVDTGTVASPSTLAATANDFPLAANEALGVDVSGYQCPNIAPVPTVKIACYSTGGATVRVYRAQP